MTRDGALVPVIGSGVRAVLSGRTMAVVVIGLVLLVVAPAPSPVHLSYVTTDSMQPALSPNDGYFVASGSSIEPGDVITFYSTEHDSHVTHRVVDVTRDGFVTKGDNNPASDQAAGMPPVDRSQVLGEAVTVGGRLLVIPKLGVVALALSTWIGRLAAGGILLWYFARVNSVTLPPREVTYVRELMVTATVLLVFVGVVVLSFSGTTHYVSYEVVDEGGPSGAVTVGESSTLDLTAHVYRPPFTTVVIDSEELAVTERTVDGATVEMTAHVPPPAGTGRYRTAIDVQPYPSTLPHAWLRELHYVHPLLAMVASIGLALVPPVVLSAVLFDWKTPVRVPNWRWLHRLGGDTL